MRRAFRKAISAFKKYYALIASILLVLVGVLESWDTIARLVGVPGPAEVSESVQVQIAGKPDLLNVFNEGIDSPMGSAKILGARPSPLRYCSEAVTLNLSTSAIRGAAAPASNSDRPFIQEEPPPVYVFPDQAISMDTVQIGPPDDPKVWVELSFLISNSGVEETVFLDNLELKTTGEQPIDTGQYFVQALWKRGPGSLPPTGPGFLALAADVPPVEGLSRARLTETGSAELNFQLNRGEAVLASIRVLPENPSLYSEQVTITGFDASGNRFTQMGPTFTFGWVPLDSGQFAGMELTKSHIPGCEADG